MPIAVITGSGTYALPGLKAAKTVTVATPFGDAEVSRGALAGIELLHVSRHGPGHTRLSNHVDHRANIWALNELGASAVIGCTACGAVDASLTLGQSYLIGAWTGGAANSTWYYAAGASSDGHYIAETYSSSSSPSSSWGTDSTEARSWSVYAAYTGGATLGDSTFN